MEQLPRPNAGAFPFRTAILAVLSIQSAFGLAGDNEIGGLVTRMGDPALEINYFGTLLDAAFLSYGTNVLLNQAGVLKEEPNAKMTTLNDMECRLSLSVGRDPGTWMPKEWAASGARLSLPMTVRFSDEIVDLGFEGEESLNPGGSRYAKKVYASGGSFVSAQGETVVKAEGGAWSTVPSAIPGASTLNFFIDFPEEATRNDVTLPAGRVFFSAALWESKDSLPEGILDGTIELPNGIMAGVVEGPGGVFVLNNGELSIKRTNALNLWGALGDVMLLLGRFNVATPSPSAASESSVAAVRDALFSSPASKAEGVAGKEEAVPPAVVRDPERDALDALSAELAAREAKLAEREEALRKATEESGGP